MNVVYGPIETTSARVIYAAGVLETSQEFADKWAIKDSESGKYLSLQSNGSWEVNRDTSGGWESAVRIGEDDGKLVYEAAPAVGVVLYTKR